ncbi:MAG: L,D-transpeptidase family protein [Akkermansia sp.]
MKKIIPWTLGISILLVACSPSPTGPTQPVAPVLAPTAADPFLADLPPGTPRNPLDLQGKNAPNYVNPYPVGTHAHFAAQPEYPKTIKTWVAKPLMAQLTKQNSKIIICLPQQRARVYVKGHVAMDWAVSTGVDGHLTPTGVFRVMQKKEKHSSTRYGKFVKSSGKTANHNADLANGLPEGTEFVGASMPYWHRLTWDGVGLHSGKVVPGRRLSHGCIRSPYKAIQMFYDYSQMGMPAYITRGVEDYSNGGRVSPEDVKYRPLPNNDYTDNLIPPPKQAKQS